MDFLDRFGGNNDWEISFYKKEDGKFIAEGTSDGSITVTKTTKIKLVDLKIEYCADQRFQSCNLRCENNKNAFIVNVFGEIVGGIFSSQGVKFGVEGPEADVREFFAEVSSFYP